MEGSERGWIAVPAGRLRLELSWGLPLVAGVLAVWRPPLATSYLLLLSVLITHEAGHALAALACGAQRTVIRIGPFFGRALVPSLGDRREIVMALAGPAANALGVGAAWLAGGRPDLDLAAAGPASLLLTAHLLMGSINLIPLGPIDGGRAWRAWRRLRRGDAPPPE